MNKIRTEQLLDNLQADVRQLLLVMEYVKGLDDARLTAQPAPGKWSAAQVLEHLNAYSRYYNEVIGRTLAGTASAPKAWFTPGWLGNYFTNLMLPKDVSEVKNKMKAPKGYAFENNLDAREVVEEFVAHQTRLLELLNTARRHDLGRIRIPISISKIVKLKLGDTFRFLIAHEQRHFVQLRNALKAAGAPTDKYPAALPGAIH
ncbi:MAG TPA: DinB family protein [Chitinophagaceae bacterium]|jgi:uncharacterized damage-inducible protein DinB|nr:DinB family protein [Chitinophagaceae bacterium]